MDFGKPAGEKELRETVANLKQNNFKVIVVENRQQALEALKQAIPKEATVMNGSSTTLQEIGFIDYLKTKPQGWKNLHEGILEEKDKEKAALLRRQAILADYFLASPNAVTQTGELVALDASGSRTGAMPFAARNLVLVAGTQKIVPDVPEALKRIKEYVFPLENVRANKVYGVDTSYGKTVIMHKDKPGRTTVILVKEKLGF